MKPVTIRFFSPQDNQPLGQKEATKKTSKAVLTGSISPTGRLIFSPKTIDQLGVDPTTVRFKIGTDKAKRKIKTLYLIPTTEDYTDTFELVKKTNSYSIALPVILQKGGVDYKKTTYIITLEPFAYQGGLTAYALRLGTQAPKPPYTGKPRGRAAKKALPNQPLA